MSGPDRAAKDVSSLSGSKITLSHTVFGKYQCVMTLFSLKQRNSRMVSTQISLLIPRFQGDTSIFLHIHDDVLVMSELCATLISPEYVGLAGNETYSRLPRLVE